ncbi:MAG: prepilin-type N-terminal cleavage/methylation domain-containing protein [Thermodesulfobacteriota bacterium]|nr:prepilin-type N-terminal cleavage/methylation domain-containing protein [Thermodesulfobacteriota bacterium]
MLTQGLKIRSKQGKTRSGFTLIEIMIAMAILALVFTGLFHMFSQTITAEAATRFYTVAPMLAQEKMDEAVNGMHGSEGLYMGDFDEYSEYAWEVSISNAASDVLGNAGRDMKQIDVTVTLNAGEQTYTLRRYAFLE